MEILTVKNLTFTYPLAKTPALNDISFSVNHGEFLLVCGATGGGKSTLLRHLVPALKPNGTSTGGIEYGNLQVSFVCQHPDEQIVTDKVWHEIAFGLENLALSNEEIKLRIGEAASFFAIEDLLWQDCSSLSGGQKQIVNLAAAVVTRPDILILDEPTSRLDPISKEKFITLLKKINTELLCTVIVSEHAIEPFLPISDKILLIDGGKAVCFEETKAAVKKLCKYAPLQASLPAFLRLYEKFGGNAPPLTVKDGQNYIENNFKSDIKSLKKQQDKQENNVCLEISNVFFRYSKTASDVLRRLSLVAKSGQVLCICGGNGAGKSTLLSLICGINTPYSGSIKLFKKPLKAYKNSIYDTVTMLPQEVQTVFCKNTVKEELQEANYTETTIPYDFTPILDMHPYDISGGQAQLLALAMAVSRNQKLLLLDEPTKGLDADGVNTVISAINALKRKGVCIIAVTHDAEFAARCADECAMMFAGEITAQKPTVDFFAENAFYTTCTSRITRRRYDKIITFDDCVEILKENGAV